MSLDPTLLSILADPEDKGPLYHLEAEGLLYNPRLGRTFPIRNGIPDLLPESATALDAEARAELDAAVAERGLAPTFTA